MMPDQVLWPQVKPDQFVIRAEWSEYLQNELLDYESIEEWEHSLRDAMKSATIDALSALDSEADHTLWGVNIRQMGSNAQDFHGIFLWIGDVLISGLVGAALSRPLASLYGSIEHRMEQLRRQLGGKEVIVGLSYHRDTLASLCQEHVRWIHGDDAQLVRWLS